MQNDANNDTKNIAALYNSLAAAQSRIKRVYKRSKNQHYNYNYASAEDMIQEARTALSQSGLGLLTLSWTITQDGTREAEDKHGKKTTEVAETLHVTYRLFHCSGAYVDLASAAMPIICEKGRPRDKACATALTYNLSYFLRSLLLIPRSDKAEAIHGVDVRKDYRREPGDPEEEVPSALDLSRAAEMKELRKALSSIQRTDPSVLAAAKAAYEAETGKPAQSTEYECAKWILGYISANAKEGA